MTCALPPEPDDLQLLAYLDDEADASIAAHLQHCTHCRERANQLALLDDRLRNVSFRQSCPAPADLRDYAFDLLAKAEKRNIARHLQICPYCNRELVLDYAGFEPLPVQPGLVEQVKTLLASLVPGNVNSLHPALNLRDGSGQATPQALLFEAGDVQVDLEISMQAGGIELAGLVSGAGAERYRVDLWGNGRPLNTVTVDDAGNFEFEALQGGAYELVIRGADFHMHIPDIRIITEQGNVGFAP